MNHLRRPRRCSGRTPRGRRRAVSPVRHWRDWPRSTEAEAPDAGVARRPPSALVVSHEEAMTFVEQRRLAGLGVGWVDIHLAASAVVVARRLAHAETGQEHGSIAYWAERLATIITPG